MYALIVFYSQDKIAFVLEAVAVLIVWTILMLLVKRKYRKIIAIPVLIASIGILPYITIIGRSISETRNIIMMPFYSFTWAKEEPEVYRTLLLNIILFMPFGMSFPFVLGDKVKRKAILTLGLALCISIVIEIIQYITKRGWFEIDDIITNVIGAFLGSVSYIICSVKDKKRG